MHPVTVHFRSVHADSVRCVCDVCVAQVTKDRLLLCSFLIGTLLNAVLFAQTIVFA